MKSKKVVWGIVFGLVFSWAFFVMGSWRFEAANFGDLLHAGKPQSARQLLYFFKHKDPELFNKRPEMPSLTGVEANLDTQCVASSHFFSARYRPLSYLILALENSLFNYHEPYYFLWAFFLHIVTVVMLFLFLRTLFTSLEAFLGAAFFACNGAVASWLGLVSHQQYQLELLMFFGVLFLLKKHLDSGKLRYLLLSLIMFFVTLLFRETLVIFPFWALAFVYFYEKLVFKEIDYFKPILTFISYSLFSILYIVLRSIHYPFDAQYYYSKLSFNGVFGGRLEDVHLFLNDLLGVSLLPGTRAFKIVLLSALIALLIGLFVKAQYKIETLLFMGSGFAFMWPLLFRHYDARYLYLPLIFFVIGFLFLMNKNKGMFFYKAALHCGIALCVTHVFFFPHFINKRQQNAIAFNEKIDALMIENHFLGKNVCFLNAPQEHFDQGIMQALLFKIQKNGKVVYDVALTESGDAQKLITSFVHDTQKDISFYSWNTQLTVFEEALSQEMRT